jgi:histidyl-tRNA synthetase
MTEKKKFRALRGVRDILPPDSSLWNWFEQTAREVLEAYNFREIRLPIFEETELFARSIGGETDIVSKEMYTFDVQGAGELEWWRGLIRQGQHEKDPFAFERRLQEFSRLFNEAWEQDRIGKTGTNAGIRSGLQDISSALAAASDDEERVRLTYLAQSLALALTIGESVALRPEATASVVRAYIEHGMQTQPGLVKLYYMGPMFRRERPQKGRYRQFYQIGAEVLGASDHPAIDAELIEMLTVLLERSKVGDWTLLVNSIGDGNCRPAYVEKLREELRKVKDNLGADSQRRTETSPLRVFDSKIPEEQEIIEKLPRITDNLCDACKKHFAELLRQLELRQIPYKHEPRLVRGLDYYTRTTFEIAGPHQGAQNALGGGGRYDGLTEMLGGPAAKCIGFALGEDRLIEMIQDAGQIDAKRPLDVFIVWMGAPAYPAAARLARRLRGEGFCVELPAEEPKLRKALSLAERLGARFAVILGEDEVKSGQFAVKRMADGEQKKLAEGEVAGFVGEKASEKTDRPKADSSLRSE